MFDEKDIPLVPRIDKNMIKLDLVIGKAESVNSPLIEREDGLVELYANNQPFALGELIVEDGKTQVIIKQIL